DARAGQLLHVTEQARPEAGQRVELVAHELLVSTVERVGAHQRSVPDVAVEPKAVGAAPRHSNAHTRLVDIGNGPPEQSIRNEVGRLDLAIGGREGDFRGALRLGTDKVSAASASSPGVL